MTTLSIPASTIAAAEAYARDLAAGATRLPSRRKNVARDYDALFAHGRYDLRRGELVEKVYLLPVDATTPDEVSTQARLVATIYATASIFETGDRRFPVTYRLEIEGGTFRANEATFAASAVFDAVERLETLRRCFFDLERGIVSRLEEAELV